MSDVDRSELRRALADWEVFEERMAELNKDRDLGDMLIPAPVMLDSLRVMAAAARSLLELSPVDSTPAPYDIEIPDFVNRNSMGW